MIPSQPRDRAQSDRLTEQLRRRNGAIRPLPLAPGETITLSTKNADLTEVLRAFARLADLDLVIQPGVSGAVTVELRDVAWEEALQVILRTHGLAFEAALRSGGTKLWTVRALPSRGPSPIGPAKDPR